MFILPGKRRVESALRINRGSTPLASSLRSEWSEERECRAGVERRQAAGRLFQLTQHSKDYRLGRPSRNSLHCVVRKVISLSLSSANRSRAVAGRQDWHERTCKRRGRTRSG